MFEIYSSASASALFLILLLCPLNPMPSVDSLPVFNFALGCCEGASVRRMNCDEE